MQMRFLHGTGYHEHFPNFTTHFNKHLVFADCWLHSNLGIVNSNG